MLFDSTLRRELARNFGGTLVVILTIVLTILFIKTLGQAAVGRVDPQDVALLLAYIALGSLPPMPSRARSRPRWRRAFQRSRAAVRAASPWPGPARVR